MALLRFLVFTALIVVSVDGIRGGHRKKRKAEVAGEPHFGNELRRVKKLGGEPYLNRVKRLRRSSVQMYRNFDEAYFDPGLSRVKRHRRSPNPIMTMRNSYGKALARMKRVPYFRDELESLRMKRDTFVPHNERLSKRVRKNDKRHKNLIDMETHLEKIRKRKHHSPLKNLKHGRGHRIHTGHRNHDIHLPAEFRNHKRHRGVSSFRGGDMKALKRGKLHHIKPEGGEM